MKAAAEAGLAPRVRYSSVEDKISITDYIEAAPFPMAERRERMATALRTLHALPPFRGAPNHINTSCTFLVNKGPAVEGFIRGFQAANILSTDESARLFSWYEQVAAVYSSLDPDLASSHNDLKPENMVFDGHRLWLVDWGSLPERSLRRPGGGCEFRGDK
jgi:thiamine kinase-like enzyme